MTQPLPVELLLGIYLGVLTGMFPALVSWGLGFVFKYVTGVSIPAFGVVVLALALAGINGGLLALSDPAVIDSGIRVVVALLVVLMLALYAHAKGDAMGAAFPRRLSFQRLRERTISSDAVEWVGSRGEVTVTARTVENMEGYPPLLSDTRQQIEAAERRLPADLPLSELEARFADWLRTEFDLDDVVVHIDEQARATVTAAPSSSGISKRVPQGKRAVSLRALVPTGLTRGEEVIVLAGETSVNGTVVAAKSSLEAATEDEPRPADDTAGPVADGGQPTETPIVTPTAPATTGGDGRITVAVDRSAAKPLLESTGAHVIVSARTTNREYELVSLLEGDGRQVRTVTLGADSTLAGRTLAGSALRTEHDVAILAIKRPGDWLPVPGGSAMLSAGDELFVVGRPDRLDAFEGAVA